MPPQLGGICKKRERKNRKGFSFTSMRFNWLLLKTWIVSVIIGIINIKAGWLSCHVHALTCQRTLAGVVPKTPSVSFSFAEHDIKAHKTFF